MNTIIEALKDCQDRIGCGCGGDYGLCDACSKADVEASKVIKKFGNKLQIEKGDLVIKEDLGNHTWVEFNHGIIKLCERGMEGLGGYSAGDSILLNLDQWEKLKELVEKELTKNESGV